MCIRDSRIARRAISLVLNHALDLTDSLAAYVSEHVVRGDLVGTELLLVRAIDAFLWDSRESVFKYTPQLQFGYSD